MNTPVYIGDRTRVLCVLAYLKLTQKKQSYCSFSEYVRTLKKNRLYELRDEGMVAFITRVR